MDVVELKPPREYNDELKKLIKLLTFKNNKLELKGSSSLTSQQYFSDYDLFSIIKRPDKSEFFHFLSELLKQIDKAEDYWFLELKLQTKAGKKIRVYPESELEEAEFMKVWDSLDFVKIDLVARIDGYFTEVSCIYSLSQTTPTKEDYIKSLEDDIKDLMKEKKWYKILKRKFNLYKAEGDKKEMLRLSKIFNSELGKEYQLISRLEAMSNVLKLYQEPQLLKKLVISLKDMKLPENIKKIEQFIIDKSKVLNNTAKKLL
jgi:hypothetical protein